MVAVRRAKTRAVLLIVMLNSLNPYKANKRGFQDQDSLKLWDSGVTMQMVSLSKHKSVRNESVP